LGKPAGQPVTALFDFCFSENGLTAFKLGEPLESNSFVFLFWKEGRYQPLALAALTTPLRLPAEDLGQILARTALGVL